MGFRSNRQFLAYSKFRFMPKKIRGGVLTLLLALTSPSLAGGQGLETLGSRAAAMAAFVAVADDASAVVWNPAGLVSGPLFNITLGLGRTTDAPGWRAGSGG